MKSFSTRKKFFFMWENVARTEIASRYKIIQIAFVDFMGFLVKFRNFQHLFHQRKKNDLDDEWLRYFR